MGKLTEPALDELVERGCAACAGRRLQFRAYLDARLPLLGGEPVGSITWVYDGERFVDGVFEVTCAACKAPVWSAEVCPRCHADGALATILATENRWPAPAGCPRCDGEELKYTAMVPARVVYEGKRADKARTSTEMHEPGFHGYRVDCADCGTVAEIRDRCPLCSAPAPLRPRPGG
jgi:hypothetical protein